MVGPAQSPDGPKHFTGRTLHCQLRKGLLDERRPVLLGRCEGLGVLPKDFKGLGFRV